MEVHSVTIEHKSNATYKIYPIGDVHLGTRHCWEEGIKAKINEIKKDPDALWVGIGDMAEFITPSDPRWSADSVAEWIDLKEDDVANDQKNAVVKLLYPIKDKCLGMIEGNHEAKYHKFSHSYIHKNICEALGVHNLGSTCWLTLRFKRKGSTESHVINCVIAHGTGGATTKGYKLTKLNRFMDYWSDKAQIFMYGHIHDIIIDTHKPKLEVDDTGEITEKVKVGAVTGCWFRTYTKGGQPSYGESALFPPTTLGCPVFEIKLVRDGRPEISVKG